MRLAGVDFANPAPLFLILGPCVIASQAWSLDFVEPPLAQLEDIDAAVKSRPYLESLTHSLIDTDTEPLRPRKHS
jgi:hypothetical protein